MKTIEMESGTPTTLWGDLKKNFEIDESEIQEFNVCEKFGGGSFSFRKVGLDLKHLQFKISLRETTKFKFLPGISSRNYKILLFFQGEKRGIAFEECMEKFDIIKNLKSSEKKKIKFLSIISQLSDLPSFIVHENTESCFHMIFISQEWLDEILPINILYKDQKPYITDFESPYLVSKNKVVNFDRLFCILAEAYDKNYENKLAILGDLYRIIGDYFEVLSLLKSDSHAKNLKVYDSDLKAIIEIELLLHEYLMKDAPSLTDISREFGISKTKMCQLFKDIYGEGLMHYLNNLKLEKAKEMLLSTNLSVSQISDELSIHNKSYFTKWFKKRNGCLPKKFREAQVQNGFA